MNIYTFFYCCGVTILLSGCGISGFHLTTAELYEGSECITEHGNAGVCKKLPDCPSRLANVMAGHGGGDAVARCGFENFTEIVCCSLRVNENIGVRPAEIACEENKNAVIPAANNNNNGDNDNGVMKISIVRGTEVFRGEFPFMAALGYENTNNEEPYPIVYDCGGTLIAPKYILTAAHCVSNVDRRVPKVVRLGSVNTRASGGQEIPVDRVIVHPRYRRQFYNDIALVLLKNEARMSADVKPICLQSRDLQNSNVDSDTSYVAIGFGTTAYFDGPKSDDLLKTLGLSLVPKTVCEKSYKNVGGLPLGLDDTMICASDTDSTRQSDTCQGDSGGPFVMISGATHTLIGVTDFGQGCGNAIPSVYTSVYSHLDWIESQVWPKRTKM